jgi:hypothetical protein
MIGQRRASVLRRRFAAMLGTVLREAEDHVSFLPPGASESSESIALSDSPERPLTEHSAALPAP